MTKLRRRRSVRVAIIGAVFIALLAGGTLTWASSRSSGLPPDSALQSRRDAIQAASRAMTPSITQLVEGERWIAGKYLTRLKETCLEVRAPQGWSAGTCMAPEGSANQEAIDATIGATGEFQYVLGLVRPDVAVVELVVENCSTRRLRSVDNVVLDVRPVSAEAGRPYRVIARDAAGRILGSVEFQVGEGGTRPDC